MESWIIGLVLFAFAASITPGPNNLMIMASGANFGIMRSLPHWLGIHIGFFMMMFIGGMGAGAIFLRFPLIELGFRLVCGGIILWLSWKIANARRAEPGEGQLRPLTFLQATAFQWVNPKAWIMALSAISIYAPGDTAADIALVTLVFGCSGIPCTGLWLFAGELVQKLLTKDSHFRIFNVVMALLLAGSSLPMLFAKVA